MDKKVIIITIVSWIIFLVEALVGFSVGKMKKGEKLRFVLPNKLEFIKIISVLLFFSILNGIITVSIQRFL